MTPMTNAQSDHVDQDVIRHLLPDPEALCCNHVCFSEQSVTLTLTSVQPYGTCPSCQQTSTRVHSRYVRQLVDLPWGAYQVQYHITLRRFRCLTPDCAQQLFTERLPQVMQPSSRHTIRAHKELQAIGLSLGGNAGARRATQQRLSVSPTTLLRVIRQTPRPVVGTPHAIGIDEWAWRRGHRYGTILVDLQTHQILDLLPDRSPETVATWLQQHPSVQVVCRDRAGGFAEAVQRGAPHAMQVVDRFHLVQNLGDVLAAWLLQQRDALQRAADQTAKLCCPVPPPDDTSQMYRGKRHQQRQEWHQRQEQLSQQRLARRVEQFEAVHALHSQGMRVMDIARELGLSRKGVYTYLRQEHPPTRRCPQRRQQDRVLAPFESYLIQRWQDGVRDGSQLWREIQALGYVHSQRTLRRFLAQLRQDLTAGESVGRENSPFTRRRGPAVRAVVSALLRPAAQRSEQERSYLDLLSKQNTRLAETIDLSHSFLTLLRERRGNELESWIDTVEQSGNGDLRRFAVGLRTDREAICAGLTLEWSNGVTEGHVHRLKLVKRSMYGRANFDLLRARVLHHQK